MRPPLASPLLPLLPPLLLALLPPPAVAQSWSLASTGPAIALGATGDLLAADALGHVGLDEQQSRTWLRLGAGWLQQPAAVPPRTLATIFGTNAGVFLFGGADAGGPSNALWRYDRLAGDWTLLTAGGPTAPGPSPRFGARAATIGGTITLLFGGATASGTPNDTWSMLVVGGQPWWSQQPTPSAMVGRIGHTMAAGPGLSAVLFGGTAAAALGDTWVYRASGWTAHAGVSPPPAAGARMVFDPARDVTVLLHPNGETWEWNDHTWRRVGVLGSPPWASPALAFALAPAGGVVALQPEPAGLAWYDYTPSPADYQVTLDAVCVVASPAGLQLGAYQRSLPILGQTFHLRASGMLPSALFVGVYELATVPPPSMPLGCGCALGVTGVAAGFDFVPGVGGVRDWLLPIPASPVLHGVGVDVQGFVVDAAQPCFVMSTQRGQLVPGW